MDRDIPDCYDPVFQEERRQYEADRREAMRLFCDCCGREIAGGKRFYPIELRKSTINLCGDCMDEVTECIWEGIEYN